MKIRIWIRCEWDKAGGEELSAFSDKFHKFRAHIERLQILGSLPRIGIKWIAGTHRPTDYRLVEVGASQEPSICRSETFPRVFQEDQEPATVPRHLALVAKRQLPPTRWLSAWCSVQNRHDECDGTTCECHCHVMDATVLRREYGPPRLVHVAGERAL